MKFLTKFRLLTVILLAVFALVLFIQMAHAHYNLLTIVDVTEHCVVPLGGMSFLCFTNNYIEFTLFYSDNDHVWGLDENNELVRLHKIGHQNHIQAIVWGLTRTDYIIVDGCSECPQQIYKKALFKHKQCLYFITQ